MPITFRKTNEPNGWLGSMAPHYELEYDGKTWRTAEALFQALRFSDENIREEIHAQRSPMGAKFVAKRHAVKMTVVPASPEDVANMEMVLRLKKGQHPWVEELLLATGDETIIEDVTNRPSGGRHDFWGMRRVGNGWEGENTLGNLWIKLREELRK